MKARIPVTFELLICARKRAELYTLTLIDHFPDLSKWETRELQPRLPQLVNIFRAMHLVIDFLSLPTPLHQPLLILSFRNQQPTKER